MESKLTAERQVMRFDTWGDFLDACVEWKPAKCAGNASRGTSGYYTTSWSGTDSFEQSMKLARDGWKAGRERIEAIARRIEIKLLSRIVREDVNYDVEGMSFDVSRYLEGEPEHWVVMEDSVMQIEGQKHVKIVFNMTASCGVGADVMTARGAAVAALVELLEYAGHRVELWLGMACNPGWAGNGKRGLEAHIRVKPYDQPLDPDRVAFALSQPSCFRRLGFSLIERSEEDVCAALGSSYGMPTECVHEDASLYIGEAMLGATQWTSPEAAEAWVIAQLAKQGVALSDE